MENGPFEDVFPIENRDIAAIAMLVYQRVTPLRNGLLLSTLTVSNFEGSSKRRVTSLYSEQEAATRRGSVGGMSTLAVETELSKLQMHLGWSHGSLGSQGPGWRKLMSPNKFDGGWDGVFWWLEFLISVNYINNLYIFVHFCRWSSRYF